MVLGVALLGVALLVLTLLVLTLLLALAACWSRPEGLAGV